GTSAGARIGVAVRFALSVADDVAVADRDLVAREADDALDEVDARLLRRRLVARRDGRPVGVAAGVALALCAGRRVEGDDLADLVHRAVAQGRLGLELGDGVVQQPGLDALLRARVAALTHAGTLADALAQVVELRAPDVAASGDLDALDLRRVHRERALHAD